MKLSALKNKTRKLSIDVQGEILNIEYRLNAVTSALISDLREIQDSDENLTRQLQEVIVHWDLLDDNDVEIQPTLDVVRHLPRAIVVQVLDAIVKDMEVPAEIKNA